MLSTYVRDVIVPWRITGGDRVTQEIAPHTVTPSWSAFAILQQMPDPPLADLSASIWVCVGHQHAVLGHICVPGTSWPSLTVDSSFRDPLSPTACNYVRPRWRPIGLFNQHASVRPIICPLSNSDKCSCYRRLRLKGIFSHNTVHLRRQIRINSPTARAIHLLNSPTCASDVRIARYPLSHWRRNWKICISLTTVRPCRVSWLWLDFSWVLIYFLWKSEY